MCHFLHGLFYSGCLLGIRMCLIYNISVNTIAVTFWNMHIFYYLGTSSVWEQLQSALAQILQKMSGNVLKGGILLFTNCILSSVLVKMVLERAVWNSGWKSPLDVQQGWDLLTVKLRAYNFHNIHAPLRDHPFLCMRQCHPRREHSHQDRNVSL